MSGEMIELPDGTKRDLPKKLPMNVSVTVVVILDGEPMEVSLALRRLQAIRLWQAERIDELSTQVADARSHLTNCRCAGDHCAADVAMEDEAGKQ